VVIKVFGDDSAALRNKAKEMCAAIADIRGVDTAWRAQRSGRATSAGRRRTSGKSIHQCPRAGSG
jgi:hypothetical protein